MACSEWWKRKRYLTLDFIDWEIRSVNILWLIFYSQMPFSSKVHTKKMYLEIDVFVPTDVPPKSEQFSVQLHTKAGEVSKWQELKTGDK